MPLVAGADLLGTQNGGLFRPDRGDERTPVWSTEGRLHDSRPSSPLPFKVSSLFHLAVQLLSVSLAGLEGTAMASPLGLEHVCFCSSSPLSPLLSLLSLITRCHGHSAPRVGACTEFIVVASPYCYGWVLIDTPKRETRRTRSTRPSVLNRKESARLPRHGVRVDSPRLRPRPRPQDYGVRKAA